MPVCGGIGKPEGLKYDLAGKWSRRIDDERRLVYQVEEDHCMLASRTLEEGKYLVFQFRCRMLRNSKYSAIYAAVPDGRGTQFALAFGQKLKAPLTASPPVYRAEY